MRASVAATIAFAAAALAAAPPARADYAPTSLGRRIQEAKIIAIGRIETLREKDYDFAVERWIHGEKRVATLRVKRFHDWTCAQRPWPYETGQRLLVFLEGSPKTEWRPIGAACEGEVLLRDGKAHVIHAPFGPHRGVWPEAEFIAAVEEYRTFWRPAGAPDVVEAWNRLLAHSSPIVVAAAQDEVRHSGLVAGGKEALGGALAGALWAILESGPPEVRAQVARHPEWSFGPDARALLPPRLLAPARERRGAFGLAAGLALASLEPTGENLAGLIDALGDAAIPIEDRRAVAQEMAIYSWHGTFREPLAVVAAAAARTLRAEKDREMSIGVIQWLASLYRPDQAYGIRDPDAEREYWLPRLDAAAAEGQAPVPHLCDPEDGLLTAEQAAVAVPAEVPLHERAAVVWTVRAIRRGRNAEAAGDAETARREYRSALAGLFGGVEEAAKALGADPAAARERLAALESR